MSAAILDLARDLSPKLKRVTTIEWAGACPVCGGDDRFAINIAKGIWNCRVCAKGGDAIDLFQHALRVDFFEARRIVTGEHGGAHNPYGRTGKPEDLDEVKLDNVKVDYPTGNSKDQGI